MSNKSFINNSDINIGSNTSGFLLGFPISIKTSNPLFFARKLRKSLGELIYEEYNLEY